MIWREGPVPNWHLVGLALLSLTVFWLAEKTAKQVQQPYYRTKLKAAQTAVLAQEAIRDEMRRRGLSLDLRNDPWETGLIGEERTVITSDRGVSTAKVLAANPNFAAAFVDLLHRAGVRKGDKVAIGLTGSMPGWNIAMLAACSALGAEPVIIASVGASDWGANRPDLTWLDMETILREHEVFPFRSAAASLGGGGDYGRGLSPEGQDLVRKAIERNGVELIELKSLEDNIQKRMAIYAAHAGEKGYAAYVNIGGGLSSLGGALNNKLIPAGYSRRLPVANYPVRAVINRMSELRVPIINLTNVVKMAERYDLPAVVGPEAPEVGQGSLYFRGRYDISTTLILTVFLALIVFVVIRLDLKHYLGRRPRSQTETATPFTPEEAI
jgi:poly-gamma-glutamate system protein